MKNRPYLAAADVLRIFCVFFIAWYHLWQISWLDPSFDIGPVHVDMQQFVRNGYMLVDSLLLLSGFLLALPYARHSAGRGDYPRTLDFYRRRALRILPSYLACILPVFLFRALPGGLYSSPGFALKDLLGHLTFTHDWSRQLLYFTPLNGVLWTLAVEVQFYIFFPLIARFYVRKPLTVCGILALLGCCLRGLALYNGDLSFWGNRLPMQLDVYAVGLFAAWLFARLEHHEFPRRWPFVLLAGLCLLCIFQLLWLQPVGSTATRAQLLRRLPLALLGGGFLLFGSLAPAGLQKAVGNPVTLFLSGISYNFYIWHQYLGRRLVDWHIPAYVSALPNQAYEQPWQSQYMLLAFAAALAAGILGTYLVEKPVARLWQKKKAPPTTE